MSSRQGLFVAGLFASLMLGEVGPAAAVTGNVIDAQTKAPIVGATVTLGERSIETDQVGAFKLEGDSGTVRVRAPAFARQDLTLQVPDGESSEAIAPIALVPFEPRAVYLSMHGIASDKLRDGALELVRDKQVNAFVIEVKSDRGELLFHVDNTTADQIGAQRHPLIHDIKGLLAGLKEQGIYTIARIVVFKDDLLATAHPEWAVRLAGGGFFADHERMRWMDPFRKEVWDYDISIAKAAADAGFDEVQFDYVRFPDSKRGVFSQPVDQDSRTHAITGFLTEARRQFVPYNVFTAADIFGYVCWNENDTDIGQKIDRVVSAVDIVSPMLYPSGFRFGIPGYRNPVKNPHEIVDLTLRRCRERAGVAANRFRPWLQAFRDYAFGGRVFDGAGVNAQVRGAADFGTQAYMLWNPRNVYPKDGYRP